MDGFIFCFYLTFIPVTVLITVLKSLAKVFSRISDELILEKCIFSVSFSSFLFRVSECCNNWVEILLFKQQSIDLCRNTSLHLKKNMKSEVTNIPSF